MHTTSLSKVLLALFCLVWLAGCEHDDPSLPTFTFNENGECEPASLTPISSARFKEAVVGYGWKHVHTYEINPDGTFRQEDYYKDLTGAGPSQYYFENDSSLMQYTYIDTYPARGFRTATYTYSNGNRLLSNQRTVFQVLSLNGDMMETLEHLGVRSGGTDVYGYSTYRRMTAQELKETQEQYATDLSNPAVPPVERERTLFMYLPWSTNLTDYFYTNISDMEEAISRTGLDKERVLVFLSTSSTKAELFEITVNDGTCTRQILKEYTRPAFTTEEGLTGILNDMKALAPAKSYSMIVGCHGMGWLPVAKGRARTSTQIRYHWEYSHAPLTRFFGGLTAEYQTEISTLAQSLSNNGMQMEYLLFDDCYMASVEVAYDLRRVTQHLIACPTEIMAYGMPYARIGKYLLDEKPDYNGICQTFHQFYSDYTYPYGTISVTDCSRLDTLASLMKDIHSTHPADNIPKGSIQRMDGYTPVIFYDFGDYVRALCGDDTEQLARFETLLEQAVPYKAHTEKFYTAAQGPLPIERYSGITTSAPSTNSQASSYSQTSWYLATH